MMNFRFAIVDCRLSAFDVVVDFRFGAAACFWRSAIGDPQLAI
jgi:hypothetical protein